MSQVLLERPSDLAGSGGVTAQEVERLQETLSELQVSMDDRQLQEITLGDLIS